MIKGIGIDVVELQRFQSLQEMDEFVFQVLSDKELSERYFPSTTEIATIFAMKEAVLKALGCGLHDGFYWREIELSSNNEITLKGHLQELARTLSVSTIHATFSRTQHYVTALVVLV
jgi:holo-[acyl-carrier protein] synthase